MKFTKEQIENRTSDYICYDCGKTFLLWHEKNRPLIVTSSESECGLCGENKSTTHFRAYHFCQTPQT